MGERNGEDETDHLEDVSADLEELNTLLKEGVACFDAAIELLAWTIQQETSGRDLRLRNNRPFRQKVVDSELLVWLSTRDPVIFDLARFEIADLLEIGFEEEFESERIDELTIKILRQSRPARRGVGGDHLARDVLMLVAMQIGESLGQLGEIGLLASHAHHGDRVEPNLDSLAAMPPELGMARRLADRLTHHPWLDDLPDAVPTEDLIRSVWRRRDRWLQRIGLAWNKLEELFC